MHTLLKPSLTSSLPFLHSQKWCFHNIAVVASPPLPSYFSLG